MGAVKRFAAIAAALVLALLLPSQVVIGATYGDCDSAGGYNGGFVFGRASRDRTDISNAFFKASFGRSKIISLRSCFSPNGEATMGKSLVLPANINASNNWLVQLGYWRVDCPTGQTCAMPDDQLAFVYTQSDTSYGNLAVFPNSETPEVGNTYSFKIESGTTGFWIYTLRDETDNQTWTTSRPQNFASGVTSIYGFEVARYWDQVGGLDAARAKMYDLQYRRSDSTTWRVLTDDPFANCVPSSSVCVVEESLFGFHRIYVNNEEGTYDPDQTVVKAFTEDH